jgi:hypothetical protein
MKKAKAKRKQKPKILPAPQRKPYEFTVMVPLKIVAWHQGDIPELWEKVVAAFDGQAYIGEAGEAVIRPSEIPTERIGVFFDEAVIARNLRSAMRAVRPRTLTHVSPLSDAAVNVQDALRRAREAQAAGE